MLLGKIFKRAAAVFASGYAVVEFLQIMLFLRKEPNFFYWNIPYLTSLLRSAIYIVGTKGK